MRRGEALLSLSSIEMPHLPVSPESLSSLALPLMSQAPGLAVTAHERRFRSLFGVSPLACSALWSRIMRSLPHGCRPIHLLWALLFLKVYAAENVSRSITGADEKTFRKWSWALLEIIANMNVVSFSSARSPFFLRVPQSASISNLVGSWRVSCRSSGAIGREATQAGRSQFQWTELISQSTSRLLLVRNGTLINSKELG